MKDNQFRDSATTCATSASFDDEASTEISHSSKGSSNGRPVRRVSFDKVKVREYERVLSVNPPSALGYVGPSLGLGWKFNEKKAVDVDKFEKESSSLLLFTLPMMMNSTNQKPRRRNSKDILMTIEKRTKLAKQFGYSPTEIHENMKQMEKVIKQRQRTNGKYLEELQRDRCDAVQAFQQRRQQELQDCHFISTWEKTLLIDKTVNSYTILN